MPTYTALTIGPIYQTIQGARSTRAIWAASFLFSCVIEKIANHQDIEPHLEGQDTKTDIKELKAGLFPDRLIIKGKSLQEVETVCKSVLDDLWEKFQAVGIAKEGDTNPLKDFIQISIVEADSSQIEGNVMSYLHQLLDTTELQPFFNNTVKNPLEQLSKKLKEVAEEKDTFQSNLVLQKFFGKNPEIYSILKLSASDLGETKVDQLEKQLENNQEPTVEGLKNYHKYIAVVQADGDNIGATIKAIYGLEHKDTAIEKFASTLLKNSIDAVGKIEAYGGLPIYAGGDDLLFFAPVINGDKNIFDLLEELSEGFEDKFKKELFQDNKYQLASKKVDDKPLITPTLSFGLSINYYKFPMGEAIVRAGDLMFNQAKKVDGKNAVAIKLEKHSGTYFDFKYQLRSQQENSQKNYQDQSYAIFKKLLQNYKADNDSTSLIYMLHQQKATLGAIHAIDQSRKKKQWLTNLFVNRPANDGKDLDAFTTGIVDLLALEFRNHEFEEVDYSKENPVTIKRVTDILRTIKFLNQTNNE